MFTPSPRGNGSDGRTHAFTARSTGSTTRPLVDTPGSVSFQDVEYTIASNSAVPKFVRDGDGFDWYYSGTLGHHLSRTKVTNVGSPSAYPKALTPSDGYKWKEIFARMNIPIEVVVQLKGMRIKENNWPKFLIECRRDYAQARYDYVMANRRIEQHICQRDDALTRVSVYNSEIDKLNAEIKKLAALRDACDEKIHTEDKAIETATKGKTKSGAMMTDLILNIATVEHFSKVDLEKRPLGLESDYTQGDLQMIYNKSGRDHCCEDECEQAYGNLVSVGNLGWTTNKCFRDAEKNPGFCSTEDWEAHVGPNGKIATSKGYNIRHGFRLGGTNELQHRQASIFGFPFDDVVKPEKKADNHAGAAFFEDDEDDDNDGF